MHLTLKKEATKPAAKNFLKQQERFDRFMRIFNQERPHQAIGMKYAAELYVSSSRPYKGLSDLQYSFEPERTLTSPYARHMLMSMWSESARNEAPANRKK